MMGDGPETVDEYIEQFQGPTRSALENIRKTVRHAAPEAEEKMSWQMPTYVYHGNLVHFAAHSRHMGFYPGPDGIEAFKDRIAGYKWSKGAIQFPLDDEMPLDLIAEIVEFRVAMNRAEFEGKAKAQVAGSVSATVKKRRS